MTATHSAKFVMRAMVEMFDTGDDGRAEAIVSAHYVDHQGLGTGEILGVDGFRHVVRVARSGYTELDVVIEDLIADGDRVVARLTWRGTRPDGELVHRETIDIVRVESGLAIEHWGSRILP
jgi:predicted ester cyclase